MHLGDRGIFADRAAKDDVTESEFPPEQAAQMRDRRDDVTIASENSVL